jgi:hypothetical protein
LVVESSSLQWIDEWRSPKMDSEVAVPVLEDAIQRDTQIVPNGLKELACASFPPSQKTRQEMLREATLLRNIVMS